MPDPITRLQAALSGRYLVERELGRGGMATVYLAQDLKHSRPVAIKVLHSELAAVLGGERFLREIRLTANLQHPHILPLYDSGEAEGLLYYVMPFVTGETLRARLQKEHQLPVEDALRLTRNVALALEYAHQRGIIHRDVKPENILLEGEEAVVADFGIARAVSQVAGEKLTETGLSVGTPSYMSPEQAAGNDELDARSDVYALGCVLFEMLAGEPPYTGPTAQVILARRFREPVPSVRVLRELVPESVERAITKALATAPADRYSTAAQFADALARAGEAPNNSRPLTGQTRATPLLPTARPRKVLALVLVAGIVLAIGAVALLLRPRSGAALDSDLIAVAPFDVLDQPLALWHEGLVDVLSANLDGVGPLRTVSPTVVIRRWSGRADRASATQLGERTGARLAVFGRLTAAGGDSVRVTATLFDVGRGVALLEMERRDLGARVDRLADSLSLDFLRELGRTRPVGTAHIVSLGTSSLPALKAFLQGEQFLRRTEWDSALASYQRAITADSAFALPLRRASLARGWLRGGFDSLSIAYALRAGALNHGLSRRDSLLVLSDSLLFSLLNAGPRATQADSGWWLRGRRLVGILESMTRQYRNDPDAWYELGEAREHVGILLGTPAAQVVDAFDHAIALDSAFGPAYIHPIEILAKKGSEVPRRYLTPYLATHSRDVRTDGISLVDAFLDPTRAPALQRPQALDTISTDRLSSALDALAYWPDSAETAVRIARALVGQRFDTEPYSDSVFPTLVLSRMLLLRGHLRDVRVPRITAGGAQPFSDLAMFGMIPPESASAVFRGGLEGRDMTLLQLALPWWTLRRDTVAILAATRRAELLTRSSPDPGERQRARYLGAAASAYFALAQQDTTLALTRFLALPDSICPGCYRARFTAVQLLVAGGRNAEARVLLESELPNVLPAISDVFWRLLRAQVAERLGDRERAVQEYQYVVDIWRHADPELQPYVAEAKAGLQRLTAESAGARR